MEIRDFPSFVIDKLLNSLKLHMKSRLSFELGKVNLNKETGI